MTDSSINDLRRKPAVPKGTNPLAEVDAGQASATDLSNPAAGSVRTDAAEISRPVPPPNTTAELIARIQAAQDQPAASPPPPPREGFFAWLDNALDAANPVRLARQAPAALTEMVENSLAGIANLPQTAQALLTEVTPTAQAVYQEYQGGTKWLADTVGNYFNWAVDGVENLETSATEHMAETFKDVPVLGSVAKGAAEMAKLQVQITGGAIKGAGSLVGGVANIVMHPADTVKGLYAMVEHIPVLPVNPLKMLDRTVSGISAGNSPAEILKSLDPVDSFMDDVNFGKKLISAFTECPTRRHWPRAREGRPWGERFLISERSSSVRAR